MGVWDTLILNLLFSISRFNKKYTNTVTKLIIFIGFGCVCWYQNVKYKIKKIIKMAKMKVVSKLNSLEYYFFCARHRHQLFLFFLKNIIFLKFNKNNNKNVETFNIY